MLGNTSVGQLVSLQHVESFSVSESNFSKDGIQLLLRLLNSALAENSRVFLYLEFVLFHNSSSCKSVT